MPPVKHPAAYRLYGGLVIVISILLIALVIGSIFKSTARMDWGGTPAAQYLGSVGYAERGMGAPGKNMAVADEDFSSAAPPIAPSPMPGPGATQEERERTGPRVIRTGGLVMLVDSAERRLNELKTIVAGAGGFISQANLSDRAGMKTAVATVRVPSDKFEEIITQVKALASTVYSETQSGDDVTDQFVDLEARLNAAKAEESQYLQILRQADTIEETLQVTARLAEVRSRIEQMEGQLRYLRDRTDYATLSVTMTEETRVEAPTREWRPDETLRLAVRSLVVALQALVDVAITSAVFLIGLALPVVLALGVLVWLIRWLWRKLMNR